ncbi:MAG: BamA/TamA family outer membrane protein [Magnetococcales bacterium]|nr:BamA/TamA family outer membrane protein [Magnetococcales bacterium]
MAEIGLKGDMRIGVGTKYRLLPPLFSQRKTVYSSPAIDRIVFMGRFVNQLSRSVRILALFLLILLPLKVDLAESEGGTGLPYDVRIEGLEKGELLTVMKENATTLARRDNPPLTLMILKSRLQSDQETFLAALRSWGHYAGRVTGRITEKEGERTVIFQIDAGPIYRLGRIAIHTSGLTPDRTLPTPEEIGLISKAPARASQVLEAERRLLAQLKDRGWAFSTLKGKDAVVVHENRTLNLTFLIDLGPTVKLGTAHLSGLENTDPAYIQNLTTWKPGDTFNPTLLKTTQNRLLDIGLFSNVQTELAASPGPDGRWPVDITVKERPTRTIKAGAEYHTDSGPRLTANWEKRNIRGRDEKLMLSGRISLNSVQTTATLSKPHFLTPGQTLSLASDLNLERTPAYHEKSASLGASLGRTLSSGNALSGGINLRVVDIFDLSTEQSNFEGLLSFPVSWSADHSDDLLDPSQGWRSNIQATPTLVLSGDSSHFIKAQGRLTGYRPVMQHPRLVLAGRLGLGIIAGPSAKTVLVDERLFAGGSGSIRGYGFQMAGPLDGENKPTGGISSLEMASEARLTITQEIQAVIFLDAGGIYQTLIPDFTQEDLFFSTGVGIRYITPIGPLRLDVGIPLNQRPGVDDPFQIVLSIGQAF